MQVVKIVVWQDGDAWLGYLQEYPDYWTQGESLDDLKCAPRGALRGSIEQCDPRCAAGGGSDCVMKRIDLIRTIEGIGCVLIRHGAKHDWYRNPTTGVSQPVPRHREIKEHLARHIIRMLSNEDDRGAG